MGHGGLCQNQNINAHQQNSILAMTGLLLRPNLDMNGKLRPHISSLSINNHFLRWLSKTQITLRMGFFQLCARSNKLLLCIFNLCVFVRFTFVKKHSFWFDFFICIFFFKKKKIFIKKKKKKKKKK